MKLLRLPKREKAALREYVKSLVEALPNKVDVVILFGSKARSGGRPESDTDVAVVLTGEKSPALRYSVVEPSFGPIAKYGVDISPLVISGSSFHQDSPLIRRIKKEGITLWSRRKNLLAAA